MPMINFTIWSNIMDTMIVENSKEYGWALAEDAFVLVGKDGKYTDSRYILEKLIPVGVSRDGREYRLISDTSVKVKTPRSALLKLWSAKYRQAMTRQRSGAQDLLSRIVNLPDELPYRALVGLGWELMQDNRPAWLRNESGMVKHARKIQDFLDLCLLIGSDAGTESVLARSILKEFRLATK
jgi:hypothetical protein